jgi:hypothetical protein
VGVLRRKGKCIVFREEDKGHALRREQEEDLEKKWRGSACRRLSAWKRREFELEGNCLKELKFSAGCSSLILEGIASEKVLMLEGTAGRVSSSPQQIDSCCKYNSTCWQAETPEYTKMCVFNLEKAQVF